MKTVWFVGFIVLVLLGCSEKSVQVVDPGEELTPSQLDSIRLDSLRLDSIHKADSLSRDSIIKDGSYLTGSSRVVFDQDSIYTFNLTIDDSLWQVMNETARDEEYFPADLTVKGFEIGQVGLRYKGSFGSLTSCTSENGSFVQGDKCDKLSMKIKFNKYQEDMRFFGLKRLNFHAMMHDPSLMRDRVAYKLYSEMGVEAPRATHANLKLNGKLLGVFVMVEQVDGRFTDNRFPGNGDGNVYKESWPQYTVQTSYIDRLKTNEDVADAQGMVDFATWLKTPKGERKGSVADWMDVDKTLRYLVVEDVINNWDGSSGWYCWGGSGCAPHNFYMYESEDQRGFQLIPWDLDVSLHAKDPYEAVPAWNEPYNETNCKYLIGVKVPGGNEMLPPICDPLMAIFANDYSSEYDKLVTAFLNGPLSEAENWIDEWVSQIQESVNQDSLRSVRGNWLSEVQSLKTDMAFLRDLAQAKLDGVQLEKLVLYTEKVTTFESLTSLMVQTGMQTYTSSNVDYKIDLSDEGLVGAKSLKMDFTYSQGDAWSGWTTSSILLDKPSVNMNSNKSFSVWLKADRPRVIRIGLASSNYADQSSGGNYGWDVQVTTEAKEHVLNFEELRWTSWDSSNASKNPIEKALEAIHSIGFSTAPASFNSSGLMEDGVDEVGYVLLDNMEFK